MTAGDVLRVLELAIREAPDSAGELAFLCAREIGTVSGSFVPARVHRGGRDAPDEVEIPGLEDAPPPERPDTEPDDGGGLWFLWAEEAEDGSGATFYEAHVDAETWRMIRAVHRLVSRARGAP